MESPDLPREPIAARTVLGVWAHPDDEAYLSTALMRRARRAGAHVACLTATAGELGTDDPTRWPPRRMAVRRTAELRRALAAVDVQDLRLLGLPDGACADLGDDRGAALIGAVLDDLRPDLVVTFGPDGITGHPDHLAVSRWTTLAWDRRDRPGALLYATTTPRFADRFRPMHEALGVFPPGYPITTPDDEIALALHLDDADLDAKRAVLGAHASQTEVLAAAMGEPTYRQWWDVESFRLPRPTELPRPVGAIPTVDGHFAALLAGPAAVRS